MPLLPVGWFFSSALLLTLPLPPSFPRSATEHSYNLPRAADIKQNSRRTSSCLFFTPLSPFIALLQLFPPKRHCTRSSSLHRVEAAFSLQRAVSSLETVKYLLSVSLTSLRKALFEYWSCTLTTNPRLDPIHAVSKFGIFLPNANQFHP